MSYMKRTSCDLCPAYTDKEGTDFYNVCSSEDDPDNYDCWLFDIILRVLGPRTQETHICPSCQDACQSEMTKFIEERFTSNGGKPKRKPATRKPRRGNS